MATVVDYDFICEHKILIAVAEAGWRGIPCWHVFDWMCWRLRRKYPLRGSGDVINWNNMVT